MKVTVEIEGLHVRAADVRGRVEQPHGFGVDVLQGGLTLWNRQPDPASSFTATLKGVSVGTEETPIRGSGVFVAGYGDREGHLAGGALTADLTTGGEGMSLVNGVQMSLKANAFSVKPGGIIDSATIGGSLRTEGDDVTTFEVDEGGTITNPTIAGGIEAHGSRSKATDVNGDIPSLDGVSITPA